MAPKRATRSTPVTENPTTTTVTNAQLQAMIATTVLRMALGRRDANRLWRCSHTSGNKFKFSTCTLLAGASDVVEFPLGGLPDMIHWEVLGVKTKSNMQELLKWATELMDKKISTFVNVKRDKRKLDNNHQAQPTILPMRQNEVQAYAAGLLDLLLTKLEFPQELSKVHNMFHVSNLKKCYADEPLAVLLDGLHLDDKLHFVEEPLEIVGREVKRLKRSRIPLVKVRWNSKRGPEFTWEREDQFKKKYPHLFTKTASSSSAAS
ncbi:hypothetical protein Tco_0531415 [Tanacetum coccineum]